MRTIEQLVANKGFAKCLTRTEIAEEIKAAFAEYGGTIAKAEPDEAVTKYTFKQMERGCSCE